MIGCGSQSDEKGRGGTHGLDGDDCEQRFPARSKVSVLSEPRADLGARVEREISRAAIDFVAQVQVQAMQTKRCGASYVLVALFGATIHAE